MKLIYKFQKLNTVYNTEKFVLVALNLAFLGFFLSKKIKLNKDMFLWPDGLFAKFYGFKKKIPGSFLIKNIRINKLKINKVLVLGNASQQSLEFLKKKFKKKIHHRQLGYGNPENIINSCPYLNKKTLCIITLPTPKQEILSSLLLKKNRNYKIICIGGGLEIASGIVTSCPKILSKLNLEFLWRLRTDFFRRLIRLFYTFFLYLLYYNKKKLLFSRK